MLGGQRFRDAMLDPSGVLNSWMTQELFSATITTNTTITGATVSVKNSSSQTIMVDVTGANTGGTGVIMTLRAGLSGFAFITLRAETAPPGSYAWKVGTAGNVTGATANTTGVTRYDDMFLQVLNPASATGGSITVKARVFSSPSS